MCGIWALFSRSVCPEADPHVKKLRGRGPESCRIRHFPGGFGTFGFTRLAINGLCDAGMQPFSTSTLEWMCNGEIYNAHQLSTDYSIPMPSGSDCEVLGPLYEHFRSHDDLPGFFRALDGVFAIVLYDMKRGELIWGRDPYGVRPLFAGWNVSFQENPPAHSFLRGPSDMTSLLMNILFEGGSFDGICFSSERKAIPEDFANCIQVPPGSYGILKVPSLTGFYEERYHSIPWLNNPFYSPQNSNGLSYATQALRFALEQAVQKRMLTERPVAALLSGGIDSSLIASLVQKNLQNLGLPPLKTFSIGMPGSSDVRFARKVADWIGSDHTEILLTPDDFFSAIPDVIRDIESFDITTVRASVGNWLVARAIRQQTDCKVVFNGDGSDEVFGSYMYFYKAPSDQTFEDEVSRLLNEIHYFDVLRSDRSISSHGLEPRTPFLDKQFVQVARSIATCWRRPILNGNPEKWILRKAFDDGKTLPSEVLWRQKEAFSDGVSGKEKLWFQEIQDRVASLVGDSWKQKAEQFLTLQPTTAEGYYYRNLYEETYGSKTALTTIPHFWMPRWSPGATDPSARTLAVYASASSSFSAPTTE